MSKNERKHSHYFKPCPYAEVDVYRVLSLFDVGDPCLQHAIKKLLVAGGRGTKDISRDVQEAIDTLRRWQEMQAEDQPPAEPPTPPAPEPPPMISRGSWATFRSAGLLWWCNRFLHLFGWAIVVQVEADGSISEAYPARCRFRGFDPKSEAEGFIALTRHMLSEHDRLLRDVRPDEPEGSP